MGAAGRSQGSEAPLAPPRQRQQELAPSASYAVGLPGLLSRTSLPAHCSPSPLPVQLQFFSAEVSFLGGSITGRAGSFDKRAAEQAAARQVLQQLRMPPRAGGAPA